MLLFDGRGVAYSYESTVPAPLLPSSDQSNNLPQSNKAPPMVDARSGECPRTGLTRREWWVAEAQESQPVRGHSHRSSVGHGRSLITPGRIVTLVNRWQ